MTHLGIHETGFLWLFGPAMAGLMLGSWLSGRLAGRISASRTIIFGYLVMVSASLYNLGLNLLLPPSIPWSVTPIFIYTLGMSLAMPSLSLMALDPFPAQRGLAASCQTFFQSGFNSITAAFIVPALWGSTLSMALGMAGLLTLGGLAALTQHKLRLLPR
jgi:DHA1 family bicyclomycin/chloramphenicol resistance-like MFS transporter